MEPPFSIPNREVKRTSAHDTIALCNGTIGHCQGISFFKFKPKFLTSVEISLKYTLNIGYNFLLILTK
jgi:hypothetical protein